MLILIHIVYITYITQVIIITRQKKVANILTTFQIAALYLPYKKLVHGKKAGVDDVMKYEAEG